MPVILPIGYEKDWIKSSMHLSDVLGMLKQYAPEKMNAYIVSNQVNSHGENNALIITPLGEKLQSEQQQPTCKTSPYHHPNKVKHPPEGRWGVSRK